jgi:circadian clock protein KaiC
LDRPLGGGFPANTVILVSGNAGTGKTLFGLNFLLEGAKRGENCYYLSFGEREAELVRACKGIGSLKEVEKYLGKNLKIGHLELGKKLSLAKFSELLETYPKLDRIVIDNVNKLLISAKNVRDYRIKFASIISTLKEKAVSSLLICETADHIFDTGNGEAFDCDGVIHLSFLELEETPLRMLEIPKMRYTNTGAMIQYNLVINKKGLTVSKKKAI